MTSQDSKAATNFRDKVVAKLNGSQKCWVTGSLSTKVAHILPASCKTTILERLHLPVGFKNNFNGKPWNFLMLDIVLKEAFDQMRISFVPKDTLHTSTFYMKINDQSCATEKLCDGKTCIGDYEGEGNELQVPDGIVVSRRALSYQALMSYIHWRDYMDIPVYQRNKEPVDFSSEYDGRDVFKRS